MLDKYQLFVLTINMLPASLFFSLTAIAAVDTDGDGEITASDLTHYWRKAKTALTEAVPSCGGFASGMLLGLYYA